MNYINKKIEELNTTTLEQIKQVKQLHIETLGGLHQELYNPQIDKILTTNELEENNTLININSLFWKEHFKPSKVLKLANDLKNSNEELISSNPAYKAIASNPEQFVNMVIESVKFLCDQGIGIKKFYSYVETLMLLCQLYSDLKYNPHTLTLYEGFLSFDLSSKKLDNYALSSNHNPYLKFIEKYCMPIIIKQNPNIIWLNGRFNIANMAIAKLAKKYNPDVHISIVNHSSEYYSLNKITKYLKNNKIFFSYVDSVILDDSNDTRKLLIRAIATNKDLSYVPNLMYRDNSSQTFSIKETPLKIFNNEFSIEKCSSFREKTNSIKLEIEPNKVVNVHLFPNKACYWNKCTFCGINKKYHKTLTENKTLNWNVEKQIEAFKYYSQQGYEYLWSVDEAIPPQTLINLAKGIIKHKIKIKWQVRSRFDEEYLKTNVIELLSKAGLKEIRFGLESGSLKVLKLMKKFPDDFNFDLVESIINKFNQNKINVHCPMIIGFPGETNYDKEQTYNLLNTLTQSYPNFSFNVNIFGLDVVSPIYKNWEMSNISTIKLPCESKYFLGNLAEWNNQETPFIREKFEFERNQIMKDILYPWMPNSSLTPPHILYRLCETIRNTLTFDKTYIKISPKPPLKKSDNVYIPEFITLFIPLKNSNDNIYQLYNWHTHKKVELNEETCFFIKDLINNEKLNNILSTKDYTQDDNLRDYIIKKLYKEEFIYIK